MLKEIKKKMTPIPPKVDPPNNAVQAVSRGFDSVITNLRDNPALLVLVILNVIGIGAAVWFLRILIEHSHNNFIRVLALCGGGD